MAVKKKGLGRGIDSLIPQTDTGNKKEKVKEKPVVKEVIKEVVKEVKVPVPAETMMKISDIEPNRDQPRKNFDKESLDELADSIRQFGIIQIGRASCRERV